MYTNYLHKISDAEKDSYLLVINERGQISFANTLLIHRFGLNPNKFPEKGFFELLSKHQSQGFIKAFNYVKKERTSAHIETDIKNGSVHRIKWEISLLKIDEEGGDKYFCVGSDVSGQKRTQKMKQLAESHYEAVVDALNIGVILQDNQMDVIAVNQKTAELFDAEVETFYDRESFLHLWHNNIINGQAMNADNCPCSLALKTGLMQENSQLCFKTKKGDSKTILISAKPLFRPDQSVPFSVVTSLIDITNEQKLENEIREREILFTGFMSHTPNLAWIVDEDENLVYGNHAFFRYLGIDERAIGKNILQLVPPEITETLVYKHEQVMRDGQPLHTTEKAFLADGTELVFWINLFPLNTQYGKKRIGGEAVNITRQKKAEQELQITNERLMLLSQLTKDAVWEWDIKKGTIYRNQALCDIIGYNNGPCQNLSWWFRHIHSEDRRKVRNRVKQVIDSKNQSWESEYRFKKSTGEYIIVIDRGFILYENGVPVKMIGSLHDISEVKQLEVQLVHEKFEHQKEITETIFAVQEKERNRIGHELHDNVNQLLGAAKLFVETITPATDDGNEFKLKAKEYILTAIEEIRRLSREMVTPQLKEKGLISSITKMVEDLKMTNMLNVLFHHEGEAEEISNNIKLILFRIVQEQVKNTLSYSEANNLFITLNRHENEVELIIEDDGKGFDPAKTNRGIGLSNIYERTRFYGGKVVLKTAPGKGCRLQVKVPVNEKAA
ncbi:MAG: PAS domain S-box protein [Sphingobacteriales bacterium]|nr:MAG: PAS domain S-box protein [Sphingobacteriales bacterium]